MRCLALLGALITLAGGCTSSGYGAVRWPRHRFFALAADGTQFIASESIAEEDARAIEEAEEAPVYVPHVPPPPSRVTPEDPVHTPFAQARALAAIHARDVASCAASGAPPGYGHARVTFDGGGHVTAVVVDAPSGMTGDASACVSNELASAEVPPFDGAAVTVGASYFIGPPR